MPSAVVFSDTFHWSTGGDVAVTITEDAPGHEGQYLWKYHVTNQTRLDGIGAFALPAEDSGMVSNLGSSVGWTGTIGTFQGNPDLISWQAGLSGSGISLGSSADFWFTTSPADYALTNGLISGTAFSLADPMPVLTGPEFPGPIIIISPPPSPGRHPNPQGLLSHRFPSKHRAPRSPRSSSPRRSTNSNLITG